MLEAERKRVNVWRLVQVSALAELGSELEMKPESKPGAEWPSALSELEQNEYRRSKEKQ